MAWTDFAQVVAAWDAWKRDGRMAWWHPFTCPGERCGQSFDTENGLLRHMKRQDHHPPYFRYARDINVAEVTCECGYVPNLSVDNPVKCYRDHRRRVHREDWIRNNRKQYVITIDPAL